MKRLPFFLGLIASAGLCLGGCADQNDVTAGAGASGTAGGGLSGTGAPASGGTLGGTGSGTGGTGVGNGTGGR